MPGAVEGKLAVVTGATSGIGAAIAARLLAEGATVIAQRPAHVVVADRVLLPAGQGR